MGNFQKTINETVELEGVGLHNGVKVKLKLKPSEANSGIIFKTDTFDLYMQVSLEFYQRIFGCIHGYNALDWQSC